MLGWFNGSLAKALSATYAGIDATKFSKTYRTFSSLLLVSLLIRIFKDNYWRDAANRRKFLDDYAKNQGFDPLVSKNWYNVTRSDIQDVKVRKIIWTVIY